MYARTNECRSHFAPNNFDSHSMYVKWEAAKLQEYTRLVARAQSLLPRDYVPPGQVSTSNRAFAAVGLPRLLACLTAHDTLADPPSTVSDAQPAPRSLLRRCADMCACCRKPPPMERGYESDEENLRVEAVFVKAPLTPRSPATQRSLAAGNTAASGRSNWTATTGDSVGDSKQDAGRAVARVNTGASGPVPMLPPRRLLPLLVKVRPSLSTAVAVGWNTHVASTAVANATHRGSVVVPRSCSKTPTRRCWRWMCC